MRQSSSWIFIGILCLATFSCDPQTSRTGIPNGYGSRGFVITSYDDGVDITIIQHQLDVPDSTTYEFRRSPEGDQIQWPVQRIITLSATQIGMIGLAEGLDNIVAVDNQKYVFSPKVKQAVAAGTIEEVAINQELDIEKILKLSPDIVLTSQFPDGSDKQASMLQQLRIPVLPIVEWQESDPISRASWAMVIAAIMNRGDIVETKLSAIDSAYHHLSSLADSSSDRPLVLTGLPYRGTWHVPAGNSFLATMIRDAGGQTGWESEPGTGSIPLDPEAVFPIGMKAQYWLHPGIYQRQEELAGAFPEFSDFPSLDGKVFSYYRQSHPDGANAYWEEGTVRPDLVLQDLVRIFHPDLIPSASFTYHQPLP